MHDSHTERRAGVVADASTGPYADLTRVVRQGMEIQAGMGTRSAVEFLKQHGIHGEVIHRVLMGEQVRAEDQAVLAQAAPARAAN